MTQVIRILLAEDNHGDVLLVREALREHQLEHELYVMRDGLEAERYIGRAPDFRGDPLPGGLNIRNVDHEPSPR